MPVSANVVRLPVSPHAPPPSMHEPSVGALLRIFAWRAAITVLFTIPAIAAVREPTLGWRICLIALAAMIAATPFVVRALGRRRRRAAQMALETARALRLTQTKLEVRRVIDARAGELDALRARHRAVTPAAWRKLAERYAVSVILPEMSHGVAPMERAQWLFETITAIDTFLAARAAPAPVRDAATLVDHCVAAIAAAGWDCWVTPGDVVTARRGGVRVMFFCVEADVKIDRTLIDQARARCHGAGARACAIVGAQPYPAAAVTHARVVRTGLIRLAHVKDMLAWAARPASQTLAAPHRDL